MKIFIDLLDEENKDSFYTLERMDNKVKHRIKQPSSVEIEVNRNDVEILNNSSLFINFKKPVYFDLNNVDILDKEPFKEFRFGTNYDTTYWKIYTDNAVAIIIDKKEFIFGNGFEFDKLSLKREFINNIEENNLFEIKKDSRLMLKEVIK